jgi:pyruvate-ferredoxin/flavodoxin oxidoreductase
MTKHFESMDGNNAAAHIAYAFTEIASIYPITPSSTMAEVVDEWAAKHRKNIFGDEVVVQEMQSEAGAAGAVHGALKSGSLTTTFTASQGLLLMIPNMYKIAGEALPTVFHVAARALATSTLSIFGDHSDVMSARHTGFAMLSESSVQEVMDLSAVAHLAALKSSLPFMNFFDGFRTSHEIQKIEVIQYEDLKKLLPEKELAEFRKRAMSPENPNVTGTNQNPDTYFQQRETTNHLYNELPEIVQGYMNDINKLRGTSYEIVNYYGAEDATEVVIAMGSATQTIEQAVDYLNANGKKVGLLNIHLYRPFPTEYFLNKLPKTVKKIAVLDRTKEPGSVGEPLLQDIQSVLFNNKDITIIGGRYGLGSKDFLPSHALAVFSELEKPESKERFVVGIVDDVLGQSLEIGKPVNLVDGDTFQGKFWGFGSDGTVGANKSAIKIIGNNTDKKVQAYFAYDSKKSGGLTVSHLRFGESDIKATYLVEQADFISCSTQSYVYQYDLAKGLKDGGTFLLNTVWSADEIEEKLPPILKKRLADSNAKFYIINAIKLAKEVGLGGRTNTILQAAFFKLTDIIPDADAINYMKADAEKTYGKKGKEIVEKNIIAIDKASELLEEITVPSKWKDEPLSGLKKYDDSTPYLKTIFDKVSHQEGEDISVKQLIDAGMLDGTIPVGTAALEKRSVSAFVPEWLPENCIQCNQCSFVCPHAAIRPILADEEEMKSAPEGYITKDLRGNDGLKYRIQVSIEDCTGCGLCIEACPAANKALVAKTYDTQEDQIRNWAFAMTLKHKPNPARVDTVIGSQYEQPLLEFSGACAGCGETPYAKLLTQLFGSRMTIANATGCSSIWGGAFPASPWTTDYRGYGPTWSNSLFEDNAEYGLGIQIGNKARRQKLINSVKALIGSDSVDPCTPLAGKTVSEELKSAAKTWLEGVNTSEGNRERVEQFKQALENEPKCEEVDLILAEKELLAKPSQWIIGGDGWAYDIGYGGLDHVVASGEDVNIFVFDNEVYSNTGGQRSKSTPAAAIAKFSAGGNRGHKKDLGQICQSYKNVFVAQVAWGANPQQAIKAIKEAEAYDGPSIIIGYTPCILHGLKGGMFKGISEQKEAVESGYWALYRYNPALIEQGKNPMQLDYKKADFSKFQEFIKKQNRFSALTNIEPGIAENLFKKTEEDAKARYEAYQFASTRNNY